MVVNDANNVESLPGYYDLLFIDGDHSYDATSKDYNKWKYSVKKGGHLIFHDANPNPSFNDVTWPWQGPLRISKEIEEKENMWFKKVGNHDTIAHFVRTNNDGPV